jgi:hypothetical protein
MDMDNLKFPIDSLGGEEFVESLAQVFNLGQARHEDED